MNAILEKPGTGLSPGVHRGMPAPVYHSLPYASFHRLADIARSPMHCKWRMDNPEPPTPAMLLGTAVHDLVLEAEDRVTVSGQCAGILAKGGRCKNNGKYLHRGEWYCGTHWILDGPGDEVGKSVLNRDEYGIVHNAADAVAGHSGARGLLDARTDTELTIIWQDKATGCMVKSRIDGLIRSDDGGVAFDLKTTANDASRDAFEREIWNREYHCQGALYLEALNAAGIPAEAFCLIPVEKEAPHGVNVFEVTDEALTVGREENRKRLKRWAQCLESGVWPGYDESIQRIGIPAYAMKQAMEVM